MKSSSVNIIKATPKSARESRSIILNKLFLQITLVTDISGTLAKSSVYVSEGYRKWMHENTFSLHNCVIVRVRRHLKVRRKRQRSLGDDKCGG